MRCSLRFSNEWHTTIKSSKINNNFCVRLMKYTINNGINFICFCCCCCSCFDVNCYGASIYSNKSRRNMCTWCHICTSAIYVRLLRTGQDIGNTCVRMLQSAINRSNISSTSNVFRILKFILIINRLLLLFMLSDSRLVQFQNSLQISLDSRTLTKGNKSKELKNAQWYGIYVRTLSLLPFKLFDSHQFLFQINKFHGHKLITIFSLKFLGWPDHQTIKNICAMWLYFFTFFIVRLCLSALRVAYFCFVFFFIKKKFL